MAHISKSKAIGYQSSDVTGKKIDEEVRQSIELLDHYENERETWATKFKEAEEFRNGAQWSNEEVEVLKGRGQSPIVVNRIHPAIETAKAMLTANKPQFRATGRDDSDREIAGVFSDLFSWVWDSSGGNTELKKAIDDYYVGGMGCLMVYQDPHADLGKGEVCIKNVYPLDVYFDPHSRDPFLRDSGHVIISKLMTDEEAFKQYPDYVDIIKEAQTKKLDRYPSTDQANTEDQIFIGKTVTDDNYETTREYIERYTRIKVNYYHVYDPMTQYESFLDPAEYADYQDKDVLEVETAAATTYITSDVEIAQQLQVVEQFGPVYHMMLDPMTNETRMMSGEEHEGAVPGSTVKVRTIKMARLIEKEIVASNRIDQHKIKVVASVGFHKLYERILPIENYPIIPLINIHNRNPYPESDVRIYRPLQEYINKIRSLIIAHASPSTNVKL